MIKILINLRIFFVRVVYILVFILVSPIYLYNKIDHKIKVKKNPFYTSKFVRLANRYPIFYEMINSIWNFPLQKNIYSILPQLSGVVLQVGCGTGLLNQYYKHNKEIQLINLDLNINSLKYGVRHKRYKDYIHSDINKAPIEDNSVDFIVFARCYHHIRHHKKTFKACQRILKPNGKIIIIDPVSLKQDSNDDLTRNAYMANSSVDGVIWRYNSHSFKEHVQKSIPNSLEIENINYIRQIHITNYNLKYPQTDALAIIKNI